MRSLVVLMLAAVAPPLGAQQAPPPPACTSAAHRAFDYWVGEWLVADSTGRPIATSSITRVSDGCAIAEHWRPFRGKSGRSLSWYQPADSMWHQQWIDGSGWIALFHGSPDQGEMVLTESAVGKQAGQPISRMRYLKRPDGVVRQVLCTSTDGGATWTMSFQGDYTRRPD